MSPRRLRLRLLDLAVTIVCLACVAVPFIAMSQAADGSQIESGGDVDERVLEAGSISNPLNGTFGSGVSGIVNGALQWDIYSTSANGMKLLISSDRTPTLHDAQNGIDVPDYGAAPAAWAVDASSRRFGFTSVGTIALGRFDDGGLWRGFAGATPVVVARKTTELPLTRTTVRLRGEFATALPGDARPTANLLGTAVVNL
jgi:hypothetical protein